nr:(Fe-S)-binding protein [Candidatus Njordarchaeum guaymaensis]
MSATGKEATTQAAGGYNFIKEKMKSLNLLENQLGEKELLSQLGRCLNCGICLSSCPALEATSFEVFPGPRGIATTVSRVNPSFWDIRDLIYTCTECGSCQEICPEKVPVPKAVTLLRGKIFRLRPDLIPSGHQEMLKNLSQHATSLPPEDEEFRSDLAESAMKDLGLPYKKDVYKGSAEVVYFAGCISTHRAPEIRESGKLILDKLGVNFTLLKDVGCCGLPASLIGDTELADKLVTSVFDKVRQVGAKTVIATCSGCANTLQAYVNRMGDNAGIQVKHLAEYLVEDVGIEKVSNLAKSKESKKKSKGTENIAIHSACHLSRHLSRRIQDYVIQLAEALPGVQVTTSNTRQRCCGAGGLLSIFKPDVSNKITSARLQEILEQGKKPEKIVAPCPTCVIQMNQGVSNSAPEIKVEDFAVLLARKIV